MPILTTSLVSFSSWLGLKIADKGFDSITKKITASEKINKKFYDCVEVVSAKLEKKYPTILGGGIDYFFKREEVLHELMKLLFRDSKINIAQISKSFDTDTLPPLFIKEFIQNLKRELLKDIDFNEILSNKELFIILQGVGKNAELIANTSTITATEIVRISRLLEERLGKSFSYNEFYKTYRNNALNNLQQINFLGLGIDISIKKKRKNLQDIFIKPFFRSNDKKVGLKTENKGEFYYHENKPLIKYEKILEATKLVILGNPGSGKSLLVKAVMCDILEERPCVPHCAAGSLPFRIELRKYLAFKKENKGNILKYLVSVLEEEFQVNNVTETILEHIFKEQKCYIFFDGLDEIFNIEDKIDTKNDI